MAGALLLGPRLLEGQAALLWTRYHLARATGPRAADHARQAVHWGVRALELGAPLPPASEAGRLALSAARQLEAGDSSAASPLYAELETALARLSTSRVRGLGLAELTAAAKEGEERTRGATAGVQKE
jgi:hypothetical protein